MLHKCSCLLVGVGVALLLFQSSTVWAQPFPPYPSLHLDIRHTGNFTVGMQGVYTLVVSNVGQGASSGVIQVTDSFNPAFTFVSSTGAGWSCAPYVRNMNVIICTSSSVIPPGGLATPITMTFIPTVSGTFALEGSVDGGGETPCIGCTLFDPTIVLPAVPTLPEWAMIVLTGLLALAGVAALRRRTT